MNFGENLKLLRKNSKMSQEVLAEKLGVSRQSVSKWEVGSAYPEMTNITALCTIFHCNINDLINENIIDIDSFDNTTKEEIVKFKENQQKNMKIISKIIYLIALIGKIIFAIPTICLIIACIVFPIISNTFSIEENKIKILNYETSYSIENNNLTIDGENFPLNTSTDIKEFIQNHDNTFFIISIEYLIISITISAFLTTQILHYIYKFYKNVYEKDTPFTIENEKILKKIFIFALVEMALTKITGILYSIIVNIDLAIEFSIIDFILILILVSIVYMFKYGRMIQADSKAKIYGKTEE